MGKGGECFDVTPLALREQRVEGEGAFARAAQAGDNDEFPDRQIEIEILEVVMPHAAEADRSGR